MELNEYQKKAMGTCMDSSRNYSYMKLNLIGEVGELSSKIAKLIRAGHAKIENNQLIINELPKLEKNLVSQGIKLELGDILWQTFGLISVLGFDANEIAQMNLDKLSSRKKNNKIEGEGDFR